MKHLYIALPGIIGGIVGTLLFFGCVYLFKPAYFNIKVNKNEVFVIKCIDNYRYKVYNNGNITLMTDSLNNPLKCE